MHTDFESGEVRGRLDGDIEKTVRHLLVRTPLLTQLRIAETHNIKAETANPHAGINAADEKSRRTITCDARNAACSVADLLPATGEVGTAYTDRAGTRFSSGAKGFLGESSSCRRMGFLFCIKEEVMQVVMKSLEEIHPYENNPRINDKAAVAVAKSIEAYGFKVPIVIAADGEIVCGHTRYKAAQELKLKEVPCVIADDLTPEQIKAFRLADNKVSDVAIWDNKKLLQELDELDAFDDDALFTGFELGGLFDNTLDESDKAAVENNEFGVMYEAVFKSDSKEKLERLQKYWEGMQDERENADSGDIGETSGNETEAPDGEKQN